MPIKIPQPTERPIQLHARNVLREGLIRPDAWAMTIHRRGPRRLRIGEDPLEARAVPHDSLRGTLPERIMYLWLQNARVNFDFQCLAGHHRVLTSDLRWVPIKDLKVGDRLINTSENQAVSGKRNLRSWESGEVIHNEPGIEEAVEVHLSDGSIITATLDHPWLARYNPSKRDRSPNTSYNWMKTRDLKVGTYIPKFFHPWDELKSWEAGWVAGFFDGEGAVVHSKSQAGADTLAVTMGQNPSPMLDRAIKFIQGLGFDLSVYDYSDKYKRSYDDKMRKVVHLRIAGGKSENLRFLGSVRPTKLLKVDPTKLGKVTGSENVRVEKIVPVGRTEIYRLSVSNKTYVADGFVMHNSSLLGGRLEFGGIVADFILPDHMYVLNPAGPTHSEFRRIAKDEEQTMILAEFGYRVFIIPEEDVYNEYKFEEIMRSILGLGPVLGGGSATNFSQITRSDENDETLDEIYLLTMDIDTKLHQLL